MNKEKLEQYDLYSKVLLGIIGLFLSGFLGYIQYNIQNQQNIDNRDKIAQEKNSLMQQNKFQILKIVNDNLPYFAEKTPRGSIATTIIVNSASKLSQDYSFPDLAQLLNSDTLKNKLSKTDNLVLTEASSSDVNANQWFCVVGSFSKLDAARNFQNKISGVLAKINVGLKANIYLTRISKSYAVTLGDILTLDKAKENVRIAKNNDLATDAFYQINRDWTKIIN